MSNLDYSDYPRKGSADLNHLPGENGPPIINQTLAFLLDTHGLSKRLYQSYGPLFRSRVLFQDVVVALGPEANQQVLTDRDRIFSNKLAWDPLLDRLFPNGLMLRDFDEHRHHRRILQSAFKKPVLENYLQGMGRQLSNGIGGFAEQGQFGFKDAIKELLLDVAAEVFLGVDIGDDAQAVNQAFVDTVKGSTAVLKLPLGFTNWGRALKGRATLEAFIEKHIPDKRSAPGDDFFSQICVAKDEEGNVFSDQAVRDHVIFLLFAAHDTTTSTLCSAMYLLATHPEWQDRLHDSFKDLPEQPSYDELNALEECLWVLKETLRLHPPLTSITRRCLEQTELLGQRIPRNAQVSLSPLFTHYMEEWWDRPEAFEPDRFGPERAEHKRHSFQWLPFGGGAHKCIGLNFAEIQVKLFLFHLLKDYRVSVPEGYQMKVDWVPLCFPRGELPVILEKRKP